MTQKTIVAIAATLALAACATRAGYEKILNAWVGHSEAALVSSWGAPHRTYDSGSGTRILTFHQESRGSVPILNTQSHQGMVGNIPYYGTTTGGYTHIPYHDYCTTSFTLVDGTVTKWSYQGNTCRALERSRDVFSESRGDLEELSKCELPKGFVVFNLTAAECRDRKGKAVR